MKRDILQKVESRMLFGLLIIFSFLLVMTNSALAVDKPQIPKLSLIGAEDDYLKEWYPDGRLYVPRSGATPREFLLPVWIDNRWMTFEETKNKYPAEPIRSFQFSLLYDSSAIRAVGVQKFGPRDESNGYEPLAKHFNITWWDTRDTSFKRFLKGENTSDIDRKKGRSITIVGSSTSNFLPLTDETGQSETYKVLLYVRFQIVPKEGDPIGVEGKQPIYIAPDTIKYNDLNIRTTPPFENMRKYDPDVINDYPNPSRFTGLAGVNNEDKSIFASEPCYPGTIWVVITDDLPQISFSMERAIGQQPPIELSEQGVWNVLDPITVDSNSVNPELGTRMVQIKNLISGTRLLDVEIVSDKAWLEFRTRVLAPGDKSSCGNPTRKCLIPYIDNGILGVENDIKDAATSKDGDVHLEIRCDPSKLSKDDPNDPEKAGVYVGYITFQSHTALFDPIRLRVTFIYFRNPREGQPNRKLGIMLTMRNSSGTIGDSCKLLFGTGHRATDGVDSLFGEYPFGSAQLSTVFNARFYPLNPKILRDEAPYGFGDWAPNDELTRTTVINKYGLPMSGSRDIRDVDDTLKSILYYVKFEADGDQNYPITIEWDTTDFIPGSQLYLRDAVNGSFFNVNMRQATPIGGSRFSYVIHDPRWKEYIIEYTLPKVVRYVDEYGNPIIKPGWNFLSMVVRPHNSDYRVFYPNAINKPLVFTQNQYQEAEILKPGFGYFVKYPIERQDVQFPGVSITKISKASGDPIRLYKGWNSVGALTFDVNVDILELDDFDPNDNIIPNKFVTLAKGIWAYKTDRGYHEVSTFTPGLGHWLYADAGSYFKLVAPIEPKLPDYNPWLDEKQNILSLSTKLMVRDNSQKEGVVYITENSDVEINNFMLPPQPPIELFDVRFANNNYLDNSNKSTINLQGVQYPVSISIEKAGGDYTFVDPITNQIYGTIARGASGNVIINDSKSNSVVVLKSNTGELNFDLTNYPNPFSTVTNIKFGIPEESLVTIKLYDEYGCEIRTLLNEKRAAGYHTDVRLDASQLVSGNYICKMMSGNQTLVRKLTVVK